MAQSYIPHEAYITCTEMKSPTPVQLYYSRSTVNVINFNNNKAPLLTIRDKKLSNSLDCKINSSFWGGLAQTCAMIGIGAAVIAITIGTGGAALPLIISGAAFLGSGIALFKSEVHDCDITLESEWFNYHDTVNFNKHPALIKSSNMICNKGGALNIMLDKARAYSAAEKISQLNIEENNTHVKSQTIQSLLMLVSTKGNPIALVVAVPLTIFNYVTGEDEKEQTRKDDMEEIINGEDVEQESLFDKLIGDSPTSARDAVIEAATDPDVIKNGIIPSFLTIYNMSRYTITAFFGEVHPTFIRLFITLELAYNKESFRKLSGSLLGGFAWGMASSSIDAVDDVHEDNLHRDAISEAFEARKTETMSLTVIAGSKK